MARTKVGRTVGSLGDYLREQRTASRLSLRQLADQVGGLEPVPEPDRARPAPPLRRGAAADRQGPAHLRGAALHPCRHRQPPRAPRRLRGAGRPRRRRALRASEADVARRVRVVHRHERSRPRTSRPATNPTTRRSQTWPRPRSTSRPSRPCRPRPRSRPRSAFHAGVGVTDLAVEVVRDYAAGHPEARRRGPQERRRLRAARAFGTEAVEDASTARSSPSRLASRRSSTSTCPPPDATPTATWSSAARPSSGRIRRQKSTQDTVAAAETTVAKAKTTRTQATTAAKKIATAAKTATTKRRPRSAPPPRSSAKATRPPPRRPCPPVRVRCRRRREGRRLIPPAGRGGTLRQRLARHETGRDVSRPSPGLARTPSSTSDYRPPGSFGSRGPSSVQVS